jgi:hypothetical protein
MRGLVPILERVPAIIRALSHCGFSTDMMELNPIRQRIAELSERLDALRGFL